MGLDIDVSTGLELHSPFKPSLHIFKEYSNETSPARIIQNYSGLLYVDQITVLLGDKFFDKIRSTERYILEVSDELGTFWCSNLSQIVCRLLTFTYKLNKNEKGSLSSITYFICVNRDLDNITNLRGRFQGNFRLKSKRSLEMSSVFDALYSLGFKEIQNFGELQDFEFKSCYPIFKTNQVHSTRSVEHMEIVEKVCFSKDFSYCHASQTILSAKLHSFTYLCESDIVIKTLFDERYFPELGVKYQGEKIYIILEDFFLKHF